MSLIKCPECDREVSDKAKSCPNCGYPISELISNSEEVLNENDKEDLTKKDFDSELTSDKPKVEEEKGFVKCPVCGKYYYDNQKCPHCDGKKIANKNDTISLNDEKTNSDDCLINNEKQRTIGASNVNQESSKKGGKGCLSYLIGFICFLLLCKACSGGEEVDVGSTIDWGPDHYWNSSSHSVEKNLHGLFS